MQYIQSKITLQTRLMRATTTNEDQAGEDDIKNKEAHSGEDTWPPTRPDTMA